jgi:hypothetical protein
MASSAATCPYEVSVPFRAGAEGYAGYRIPAVVVTAAGTLLAFAEGRVGSSEDRGDIDIVLKRSADGGRKPGRAFSSLRGAAAERRAIRRPSFDDHTVGLLYETGDFSAYSTITFRRIPVEELVWATSAIEETYSI